MLSKLKTKKFYIPAIILIVIVLIGITYFVYKNNYPKVAVIPITGEIVSSPQYNNDGSIDKSYAVAIDILSQIQKAEKDNKIKAIVFVIDSPGGDSTSGEEISRAVKEIKKPTVALIRSQGDSSAYWIASAADRIFALSVSDTTDIGVTTSYTDNSIQNQTNGITFHQLAYGEYKDMQNPDKPLTADEQKLIMSQVDEVANVFIADVAQNRHLLVSQVQALANGASILGQDALKDGLIDQIGSFSDVDSYLSGILHMKVNINIPSEEVKK